MAVYGDTLLSKRSKESENRHKSKIRTNIFAYQNSFRYQSDLCPFDVKIILSQFIIQSDAAMSDPKRLKHPFLFLIISFHAGDQ